MSEPGAAPQPGGLALYRDRRMLAIALMGFSSGLPLLLTTSTLAYWLRKVDVDKTAIGLFALVGLPYALKFLWAPALDALRLPGLGRLGQRRSWALGTQLVLALAILGLGASDPALAPIGTAAWAVLVAFCSATQDVAVDAYRIEVLHDREQGAGAAATQAGYRIGMLGAGAGAIALSDFVGWSLIFAGLAGLVAVGALGVAIGPEPTPRRREAQVPRAPLARIRDAVVEPLRDFAQRPHWGALLAFALFYKFGDAIAGVMANPFYVDLGFSGVEIASASNLFGVVANLAGVFVGGMVVARAGVIRALVWGGVLQAVTNLLFTALALAGRDFAFLAMAIGTDAFAGGLASAAFVAFLSGLCRPGAAATQYALLTSLMAGGRTAMSSGGGWLAEQLAWPLFFATTTLLAVPGLLLLAWLAASRRQGSIPDGSGSLR